MKKFLCSLLLYIVVYSPLFAQVPMYSVTNYNPAIKYGFGFRAFAPKFQCLYSPRELKTLPRSPITAIYFLVGQTYSTAYPPPYTFPDVYVKLGYSTDTSFRPSNLYDTFKTSLTTVVHKSSLTTNLGDSSGKWWRFNCSEGQFVYDTGKWLVVEIKHGAKPLADGFDLSSSNFVSSSAWRTKFGHTDSMRGNQASQRYLDIGFDVSTTGIKGIKNLSSYGLFPNPSTGGRFNVSLGAKKALRKVVLSAVSLTGQSVWSKTYEGTGTSFFQEVDMSTVSKGSYAMRIEADGEVLTQMVVIE